MNVFGLADELGIERGYHDHGGQWREASEAELAAIISALPAPTGQPLVDAPIVVRAGAGGFTDVSADAQLPVRWWLSLPDGREMSGESYERQLRWPELDETGTFRLKLTDAANVTQHATFIVSGQPAIGAHLPPQWLLTVQLYSLRSQRSWGIGDFTDLRNLLTFAAEMGAGGIGLNPLHVLFDDRPDQYSPYAPNSRHFLNPLYIDVTRIPGYAPSLNYASLLASVRTPKLIDYTAVAALKFAVLRASFERFRSSGDETSRSEFADYCTRQGRFLLRFACFEVMRHKMQLAWWDWPEPWNAPDDAACAALSEGPDGDEVRFIMFQQWCADAQLGECQRHAYQIGMSVGLYLDVAVGVQSGGFDAWNDQQAIARKASVGAPPDALNTAGQDWGLAGFTAVGLEREGFQPFARMLDSIMRHAGAIRLDHVLGLNRLYLVPQGMSPRDGVYVRMPLVALLAIVAQKSIEHDCIVVGEDLGTVPEGFREQLAAYGIWSYLVMIFERHGDGSFRSSSEYKTNALVTFSTHDLATYQGWRTLADLKAKRQLGIDPGESDEQRRDAIDRFQQRIRDDGVEQSDFSGVLGFLNRTSSKLACVAIEDLLSVVEQTNIPGTTVEHPNWRRPLPVLLDDLPDHIDIDKVRQALASRLISPASA